MKEINEKYFQSVEVTSLPVVQLWNLLSFAVVKINDSLLSASILNAWKRMKLKDTEKERTKNSTGTIANLSVLHFVSNMHNVHSSSGF